ncbi:hypothetical protein ACNO7T_00525 [Vibrio campbellii]
MLLICKLLQHCDQLTLDVTLTMTRLSLWTTALLSSVASFSSSAFEVDTRESQEPELDDQFRVIAIPFYDPSVDTGISVVPIYNFYADGESKNASTLSATLTYTQNDSYYIKGNAELSIQFGLAVKWASLVPTLPWSIWLILTTKSTRSMVISISKSTTTSISGWV